MKPPKLTAQAVANLEDIHERIAVDNPYRADTFIVELFQRIDLAALLPAAWPRMPDSQAGERYISHADYIITYQEEAGRIVVTRIFHAAMDLTAEAVH